MSSSDSFHGCDMDEDCRLEFKDARSIKMCLAAGCTVALDGQPKYCIQRRLCVQHIKASWLKRRDGGDMLWRFCQQCGKLEPLSAFEDNKRSCRLLLARRRCKAQKKTSPGPEAPPAAPNTMSTGTSEHILGAQVPPPAAAAGGMSAQDGSAHGCVQSAQWVDLPNGSQGELYDMTHDMASMGPGPSSSQLFLAHLQQQQQQQQLDCAGAQAAQAPLHALYAQHLSILEQERQQLQHKLKVLEAFCSVQQQQQQVWPSWTALQGPTCSSAPSSVPPCDSIVGLLLSTAGGQALGLSGADAGGPQIYAASGSPTHQQQQPPAAGFRPLSLAVDPASSPRSSAELLATSGLSTSSAGMACSLTRLPQCPAGAAAASGAPPSPTHHLAAATRVSLDAEQPHGKATVRSPYTASAAAAAAAGGGSGGQAISPRNATAESAFDIALRNMRFDSPPASPVNRSVLAAAPAAAPTSATAAHHCGTGSSSRSSGGGRIGSESLVTEAQGALALTCATAPGPAAAAAAAAQQLAAVAAASQCQLSPAEEQSLLDLMRMDTAPSLGWLAADDDTLADQLTAAIINMAAGSSTVDTNRAQGPAPMQLEGHAKVGPLGWPGCHGPGGPGGPGASATSASLSVQIPCNGYHAPVCSPFAAAAAVGVTHSAAPATAAATSPMAAGGNTAAAAAAANVGGAVGDSGGGTKRSRVEASLDATREDSYNTLYGLMEIALLEAAAESMQGGHPHQAAA